MKVHTLMQLCHNLFVIIQGISLIIYKLRAIIYWHWKHFLCSVRQAVTRQSKSPLQAVLVPLPINTATWYSDAPNPYRVFSTLQSKSTMTVISFDQSDPLSCGSGHQAVSKGPSTRYDRRSRLFILMYPIQSRVFRTNRNIRERIASRNCAFTT